jgi:hypothetical protein
MFRATHRLSSGAQKTVTAASGFTYVYGCWLLYTVLLWLYEIQGDKKVCVHLFLYCNHQVHRDFEQPVYILKNMHVEPSQRPATKKRMYAENLAPTGNRSPEPSRP